MLPLCYHLFEAKMLGAPFFPLIPSTLIFCSLQIFLHHINSVQDVLFLPVQLHTTIQNDDYHRFMTKITTNFIKFLTIFCDYMFLFVFLTPNFDTELLVLMYNCFCVLLMAAVLIGSLTIHPLWSCARSKTLPPPMAAILPQL